MDVSGSDNDDDESMSGSSEEEEEDEDEDEEAEDESDAEEDGEAESGDEDEDVSDDDDDDEDDEEGDDSEAESDLDENGDYNFSGGSDNNDDDNIPDLNYVAEAEHRKPKDKGKKLAKTAKDKAAAGSSKKPPPEVEASSSSCDENGERNPQCPICLYKLSDRTVASPSGCAHIFCLDCIREWSRNVNTCPIDRSVFNEIIIKTGVHGKELSREKVIKARARPQQEDIPADVLAMEDVTLCEVCGSGDREATLLLCDACDLGYHLECCVPALESVPRGRWYCQTCSMAGLVSDYIIRQRRRAAASSAIESSDEEDNHAQVIMPRTLDVERVRRAVRQQRGDDDPPAASAAKKKPKRKVKRKTSRKRKSTTGSRKKKSTTTKKRKRKSTATSKRKSTKRKTKRGKKLRKKRGKKLKAKKKVKVGSDDEDERGERHVGPGLSIFGNVNDLDFYGDEELFFNPIPSTSTSAPRPPQPLVIEPLNEPPNLLESIISSQTSFLTSSTKRSGTTVKMKEVYTKSEKSDNEQAKPISTSVSRNLLQQKLAAKEKLKTDKSSKTSELKSSLSSSGERASSKASRSGGEDRKVQFAEEVSTRLFSTTSTAEAKRPKVEFKTPDVKAFSSGSFKIPKKKPAPTESSSPSTSSTSGDRPTTSCDKSADKSGRKDVEKSVDKVKQEPLDENDQSIGKQNKTAHEKSFEKRNNDSVDKTKSVDKLVDEKDTRPVKSHSSSEETRRKRLEHFSKLGFSSSSGNEDAEAAGSSQDRKRKSLAEDIGQRDKNIKLETMTSSSARHSVDSKVIKTEPDEPTFINAVPVKHEPVDPDPVDPTVQVKAEPHSKKIKVEFDAELCNKKMNPEHQQCSSKSRSSASNSDRSSKSLTREDTGSRQVKVDPGSSMSPPSGHKENLNSNKTFNSTSTAKLKTDEVADKKESSNNSVKKENANNSDKDFPEFLIELIKGYLKPFYLKGVLSKEIYKLIVKKSMAKVRAHTCDRKDLVKPEKVQKLVEAYAEKYSASSKA